MKKRIRTFLSLLLVAVLTLSYTPITSDAAAKTPKLNVTKKTITAGNKETLTVQNKIANSKYTWSSSNKSVATVSQKGVVSALKKGTTTITCKVKAPKKTYTLKCKVTVRTEVTFATQKSLDKALNNPKITKITIKAKGAKTFTIKEGDFSNKTLVVNAPKADVVNNGTFKDITISAIKSNTWTENAKGNKLNVTAPTARVVVGEKGSVDSISFSKANAKVALEVLGTVAKVAVSKVVDLAMKVEGKINDVTVSAPAKLDITGTAKDIPVTVEKEAKGADIVSAVPVKATLKADTNIKLTEGAEGSVIDKAVSDVKATVDNGTKSTVSVTTDGKDAENVNSGSSSEVGGTPEATTAPTTAPSPTSTPSSSSTSKPSNTTKPTVEPTKVPDPTEVPTVEPTEVPTVEPTKVPDPTEVPTVEPTKVPDPTEVPTVEPTVEPTKYAVTVTSTPVTYNNVTATAVLTSPAPGTELTGNQAIKVTVTLTSSASAGSISASSSAVVKLDGFANDVSVTATKTNSVTGCAITTQDGVATYTINTDLAPGSNNVIGVIEFTATVNSATTITLTHGAAANTASALAKSFKLAALTDIIYKEDYLEI